MFQFAELSKDLQVFLMRTAGETVIAAVLEVGALNLSPWRSWLHRDWPHGFLGRPSITYIIGRAYVTANVCLSLCLSVCPSVLPEILYLELSNWVPSGVGGLDNRNGGANVQNQINSKWLPNQYGGVLRVYSIFSWCCWMRIGTTGARILCLTFDFKDSWGNTSRSFSLKDL